MAKHLPCHTAANLRGDEALADWGRPNVRLYRTLRDDDRPGDERPLRVMPGLDAFSPASPRPRIRGSPVQFAPAPAAPSTTRDSNDDSWLDPAHRDPNRLRHAHLRRILHG